jgi:hypothetical protein
MMYLDVNLLVSDQELKESICLLFLLSHILKTREMGTGPVWGFALGPRVSEKD